MRCYCVGDLVGGFGGLVRCGGWVRGRCCVRKRRGTTPDLVDVVEWKARSGKLTIGENSPILPTNSRNVASFFCGILASTSSSSSSSSAGAAAPSCARIEAGSSSSSSSSPSPCTSGSVVSPELLSAVAAGAVVSPELLSAAAAGAVVSSELLSADAAGAVVSSALMSVSGAGVALPAASPLVSTPTIALSCALSSVSAAGIAMPPVLLSASAIELCASGFAAGFWEEGSLVAMVVAGEARRARGRRASWCL